MSVTFSPLANQEIRIKTRGVHASAATQWLTSAPSGFVSTPKFPLDKVTIRFVTSGSIVRENGGGQYVGVPGKALCVSFDEMINQRASADFSALAGTIDRAALIKHHAALEGSDECPFPRFQSVADVANPSILAFKHNFELTYAMLNNQFHNDDMVFTLAEEMLIYQFLAAWPLLTTKEEKRPVSPSWRVRRAMEYIDAHLQSRLTLAEIASCCATGVRSLQLGFRRDLGKTIGQWILERRLAGVRRELLSEDGHNVSVAAIARKWGFSHMSDFSRRYRNFYGETPSQSRQ